MQSATSVDEDSTTDDSEESLELYKNEDKSQRAGSTLVVQVDEPNKHNYLGFLPERSPIPIQDNGRESTNNRAKVFTGNKEEAPFRFPDDSNEGRPKKQSGSGPSTKLGKIGGKRKELGKSKEMLYEPAKVHEPVKERQIRDSILLKNSTTDVENNVGGLHISSGQDRTSRHAVRPNSPLPRESSREKGNRKRAELKREFEEKGRGTAKKKRKF